ncbi:MAG TPA: hypothetical protein P5572_20895, partial [Phycisphaerae bacterium]|nr:hypothetical protein [Phycisphaerae bacterium]
MNALSSLRDPLPAAPRWLLAAIGGAGLAALVVVLAPTAVARRLTVSTLPAGADLTYARDLLRYLAIAAAVMLVVLAAWWRLAPRFRMLDLGRWVLAATLAVYVAAALSMWWYVDDDAGISFTFARNLADGHGLIFNPGEPPVEGYSNPLWVALLAGARLAHLDIILTAKVLGLACGVLGLLVLWRAVRALHPVAWLALPLAGLNAAAVVWTNSGLENALHALLLIATVVLLPAAEQRSRARVALIIVLCMLTVSRPEGLMFALAAATYLAVRAWRRHQRWWPALGVAVLPLLVFAGMVIFRLTYFGDPLPNTFYAKASSSNPLRLLNPNSGGWAYVAEAVSGCGWTLGLLPILIALAAAGRGTVVSSAGVVVAAQLFFVVTVGGDWMKEFRFIAPIVPAVSLLIGAGLARIVELLQRAGLAAWRPGVACGVLASLIVYPQVQRLIAF